jgi:hypothetical protein
MSFPSCSTNGRITSTIFNREQFWNMLQNDLLHRTPAPLQHIFGSTFQ